MSAAAPLQAAQAKAQKAGNGALFLQRKCACGSGASALTGECEECSKKKRLSLQTKLKVNAPGDIYEQEADRIAEQVMATPAHPGVSGAPPRIQRFSGPSNGPMDAAPASVDQALASPGRPLEPQLLQDMEHRFGYDFSRVRVHADAAAGQSAKDMNANAYTVGDDIVFGPNRYEPRTPEGRRLLAHELTHVVQQRAGGAQVQRASTRGAGGCAAADFVDEDVDGPKGAGRTAHTQIQSFLLPRIINEVEVPRATKRAIASQDCQADTVHPGRADLYLRGGSTHEVGEIKPIRHDMTFAVEEADHYIRRAQQSLDRFFGIGAMCLGATAGADDTAFARRIAVSRLNPNYARMSGILTTNTVIGPFADDTSKTLKAKLHSPGAIGYWCTGGTSDTFTCGASDSEITDYIDRVALAPVQSLIDTFIRDVVEERLRAALEGKSLGEVLEAAERHFGTRIRNELRPFLGPAAEARLISASAAEIGRLIEESIGPEARAIVLTLIRRVAQMLVAEMRQQLRNVIRTMIREALVALCVGVPVVTLAELLERLRRSIRDMARILAPAVVTVVAQRIAAALARALAEALAELVVALARAVGTVLAFLGEIILRLLAAVLLLLIVAGVIFLVVVAFLLIFDPAPGDEVAVGAAALALASLIPIVGRFVVTGSTEEEPDGA
jgi:hypothetical protein